MKQTRADKEIAPCTQTILSAFLMTFALYSCHSTGALAVPVDSPDSAKTAPPDPPAVITDGKAMPAIEAMPSINEMASQMLMVGFKGTMPDSSIVKEIAAGRVGNIILFEKANIRSPEQLAALISALRDAAPTGELPLWIGIDQEGGAVQRLRPARGFRENYPTAEALGRRSVNVTREVAERMGAELAALGIDIDFAPVVDVNVNPRSPAIGGVERSFSADSLNVARHAEAFAGGLRAQGIFPCIKHFPGHGSAAADTHEGTADVTATWREIELDPYRMLFANGFTGAVMTGHVYHAGLDSEYPASLSAHITTDLLRGTLGWEGLVITDDLNMGAITQNYTLEEILYLAICAGADILLYSGGTSPEVLHRTIVDLVRSGKITEERLYESWRRIKQVKTVDSGKKR